MDTWVAPLRKCPSLIDFLKSMYDILEAHRWAVLECNVMRQDISHCNIFVLDKGVERNRDRRFTNEEQRPIFVDEVLENVKPAHPMARLVDMDNAAEPDTEGASFLTKGYTVPMKDRHLRRRGGPPKFVARSPAVGRILVADVQFRKMPVLPSRLAARYAEVHCHDRSGLRAFSDNGSTRHGGVYTKEMQRKHEDNRKLRITQFEHRPRHAAESVFWCIVVFLLLAVPLGSAPENPHELEDPAEFGLNCAWKYIASHEIGVRTDTGDSRLSLLREAEWGEWLHPELAHAEDFLLELTGQIRPEWGLIEPPPRTLHLHEAMQRVILQYIDLWKTQEKDVQFDTQRIRPAGIPNNHIIPHANFQGPP